MKIHLAPTVFLVFVAACQSPQSASAEPPGAEPPGAEPAAGAEPPGAEPAAGADVDRTGMNVTDAGESGRNNADQGEPTAADPTLRVIEYHADGRKRLEGDLVNGVRSGLWTSWNRKGFKEWQGVYVDGELHGPYSLWNGHQKTMEGSFRHGHKEGRWVRLSSTSTVASVETYKNDMRHGSFQQFHGNGKIATEGLYEKDKRVGPWTTYWEDGTKQRVRTYVDGHTDGPEVTWHNTGEKASEGQWKRGRREGPWKFYDQDGTLRKETTYRNNRASNTRRTVGPGRGVPARRAQPARPAKNGKR